MFNADKLLSDQQKPRKITRLGFILNMLPECKSGKLFISLKDMMRLPCVQCQPIDYSMLPYLTFGKPGCNSLLP